MPIRPLALRKVDGHVTTGRQTLAWYRIPLVRWSWRSIPDREGAVTAFAQRLAQLEGHRLTWRVTHRPSSAEEWGRRLDRAHRHSLPGPGWVGYLSRCISHLGELDLSDKEVYFAVDLAKGSQRNLPFARRKAAAELEEIDRIMAGPGINAEPAAELDLQWLLHTSVALGCPTLDDLGDGDQLIDRVHWSTEPFSRAVKVVTEIGGELVERYVVTLTIGRMGEQALDDPFLARVDRLPFPVDMVTHLTVLPRAKVNKQAQDVMLRVKSQVRAYQEHELDPPFSLEAQRVAGLELVDELERGDDLATRVDGWFRFAVSGADEKEALARAARLTELYSPGVKMVRPWAQAALAREFLPGEKMRLASYRRRMPVTTAAASVPMASASVGHRTGFLLGHTVGAGGRKSVSWDPWYSMEVAERSGLALLVGNLGSGKSALVGQIAYAAALSGSAWVTLLDPSGPLSRLCDVPELAEHARHVELMGSSAAPGVLNSYRVIPDAKREHCSTEAEYVHRANMVEGQRKQLTVDILNQFLPDQLRAMPETLIALKSAVRVVPAVRTSSPHMVIDALRKMSITETDVLIARHARIVADFLHDVSTIPMASLIFPSGDPSLDDARTEKDIRLTVISLRGLALPKEGSDRRDWSAEEALAAPVLNLAAWWTSQSMAALGTNARKLLGLDETWNLSRTASGRLLLSTAARDSRKWNERVLLSSQAPGDLLAIPELASLIDAVFGGRLTDETAQTDACRLFNIGREYGSVFGTLSPPPAPGSEQRSKIREFVFSDGQGIERMTIDQAPLSDAAREALDTTPTGVAAR